MSLKLQGTLARGRFDLSFDLDLPAGGFTAVCGPSGAGKSTLLRCIAGLEPGFIGTVRIGPEVWQDATRTMPVHRRAVGYVFQTGELFPHLDVAGNLRFALDRTPAAERHLGWADVVPLLGLEPLLTRTTPQLSGGERQRVALGRALLRSPDLLLLDEPLAALDHGARREIYPLLERMRDEWSIPVLYVTHSLDEAARLADRLVLLAAGRVSRTGPLAELLTTPGSGVTTDEQAGAVVVARVGSVDTIDHLAQLDFHGGSLQVANQGLHVGQVVRVRIHARDVSLALTAPTGTSILNILPATVERIWPAAPGRVMVRLLLAETVLLAAITARSAQALALAPGSQVWAQVKSVALL